MVKINPVIKMNIALTVHPLGLGKHIQQQIDFIQQQPTFNGAKKVLIIGGSTGYGLASRIALAFGSDAQIISISRSNGPTGKRTGTAGFWNNLWFEKFSKAQGKSTYQLSGNAFDSEFKKEAVQFIKETLKQVDLVIYSLAAPKRQDPITEEIYTSALKPIDDTFVGQSVNILTGDISKKIIEPANQQEIEQTIKVMGGEDWQLWIETLLQHQLLAPHAQTFAYTYIGSTNTAQIYRHGTIGYAKNHLEQTAQYLNQVLADKINGSAQTVVCKAVMTKASAVIPNFPLYAAALKKVMQQAGTEESPIAHIYRFFSQLSQSPTSDLDDQLRYRIDKYELDPNIQQQVEHILSNITQDNLFETTDFIGIQNDFMQLNGFHLPDVDYEADIDIENLIQTLTK